MLDKLRIEQTKSRAHQSNDNALAESKNASVVRKHRGYNHIPKKYAKPINVFYEGVFNSWLNLHRPCLFASEVVSQTGKVKKVYKNKEVLEPVTSRAYDRHVLPTRRVLRRESFLLHRPQPSVSCKRICSPPPRGSPSSRATHRPPGPQAQV